MYVLCEKLVSKLLITSSMKYLLLVFVKLYWFLIPREKRNVCLFKITCSLTVYQITMNEGFIAGIKVLFTRYKQCRPGYEIFFENDEFKMRCIDGSIHDQINISQNILNEYL